MNLSTKKILLTCIFFNCLIASQAQCPFQQFMCGDGSTCLLSEKLCNGVSDCPGNEDEEGSEQWDCSRVTLGTSSECGDQRKFFRCRFGGCVSRKQVCDGSIDCWGGSDEAIDLCGSKRPRPSPKPSPKPPQQQPTAATTYPTTTKPFIPVTIRPTRPAPPIRPSSTTVRHTYIPPSSTSTLPPIPTTVKQIFTTPPPPPTQRTTSRTPLTNPPEFPESSIPMNSCPPIELDEGQEANCYNSEFALVINCKENLSPEGTTAKIGCKPYWAPPATGSRSTERTCTRGKWMGRRRFRCDLECGQGGFAPVALVAGGITSKKGKWPWHAGIYESDPPGTHNYNNICGATLISQRAILTAGHCVTIPHTNEAKNIRDLLLFLGKFNRSAGNNDKHVQPIKPIKIVVHPDYNYANLDSDIAIIWLEKEARIDSFVHPVCIPYEDDELEVGSIGVLAGWGSIGDRVYPEQLQEAELPFVSSKTCKDSHGALKNLVRQSNFCAGHKNGTSACDGDSGGGLVFPSDTDKTKWVLQGVVSGGVPKGSGRGCDPNHYVAFTRVSKFRDWIDKILDRGPPYK